MPLLDLLLNHQQLSWQQKFHKIGPQSYQWSYGAHLYPCKWPKKVELEWVRHGFWPILHPSTCIHLDLMVPSNPSVKFLQRLLRQPFEDGVTPYPIKTMVDENDGWSLVSWVIIGKKNLQIWVFKKKVISFLGKVWYYFQQPWKIIQAFCWCCITKSITCTSAVWLWHRQASVVIFQRMMKGCPWFITPSISI